MRRAATAAVVLLLAAVGAAIVGGTRAEGSSSARFDVIFDDARGLIGGQLIKIAGARAGTINNVTVTPQFKARIEASVDSRFMPFHQNATCTIRPEGLIAENYIDCDPGTADSPVLKASGGHPPTVPVTNTTEPVSLLDLFNIFNLPTRQRFTVLVDELGIGTAGRGGDFNEILRRANPALALARQAISVLARQKAELGTIIDATNQIATEGAGHTAQVQRFIDSAARLSTLTAAHSGPLARSIALLPGLLAAAEPSLQDLDTVAKEGTPLVQQLGTAVPGLIRVQNDLGPFAAAAKPALAKLSGTLKRATGAIRDTTPLVTAVRRYTQASLPGTKLFARLSSNLQQHGFIENFLSIAYYISASLARFDGTSHLLSILLVGAQNGLCGAYATKPVPGCSAHYGSQPAYKPARGATSAAAPPHGGACDGAGRVCARGAHERTPSPGGGGGGRTGTGPAPAQAPAGPSGTAKSGSGGGQGSSGAPSPGSQAGPVQQAGQTLQNLISYLLK